ncbi:NTP transferase domain-containing protein [Cryobacterium breve]|uniref:NTP transferase domain-containing protein n=1 Tax=Cryobacterium breve TaxID=1259258 RepID=A0ABY7NC34_9MICO|nr:NTP transferase domain-containing protein [Cryobacterium breve]WBM80051.1 NTP transferase domain-containing protein [Cryobacterium breve]
MLAGGRGSRLGGAVKPAVEVAGRTLLSRVLDARTLARRVVIVGPASARSAAGPEATGALWALEDPPFGGPVAGIAAGLAALARPVPAPVSASASASTPGATSVARETEPIPDADAEAGRGLGVGVGVGPETAPSPEAGPAPASTAPVPAEWLLVLACDLPWAAAAAGTLVAALADQAVADRAGTNTSGTDAIDGLHLSDPDGHPQWLAGLYRASALRNAAARLGPRAGGASMRALLAGLRLVGVADETGSGRDVDTWEDVEWSTALLSAPSPISTTPPRSETE